MEVCDTLLKLLSLLQLMLGGARNFIKKETLAQVFSCEFYEIFKSTFL